MNQEPLSKAVYTTSEAARLCNLSRRAIVRYVECGKLKALRLAGSRKRRILRESLLEFMRARGLPTTALETACPQASATDPGAGPSDLVLRALAQEARLATEGQDAHPTASILEAQPEVLVVNLSPDRPGAQIRLGRQNG